MKSITAKEMLKTVFPEMKDPEFDLLFASQEEGQTYVDRYKASILADGSKVVAERVNLHAAAVFHERHRPAYRICKSDYRRPW